MDPKAMRPFGEALVAYSDRDRDARLTIRCEDGREVAVPVALFFREEAEFTRIEQTALARSRGRVLDIGSGAGSLSLALQLRGHLVTALDISPEAFAVAARRGVRDVVCNDIFGFEEGPFDTLLMLGRGVGMVETVTGLNRFLDRAHSLTTADGQLFLDSLDVQASEDPGNLAYHEANRMAGRYHGRS